MTTTPGGGTPRPNEPTPIHLVGEEDDQNACGLEGPNALYWRKVTCPDCIELIEAAEQRRLPGRGAADDPTCHACNHVLSYHYAFEDGTSGCDHPLICQCERFADEPAGRGAADGGDPT